MQKITPFLWFDTQAEEAANFYVSVFKNSKITSTTRYDADAANASALRAQPSLADDLEAGTRFDAARAAALAGCGVGAGPVKLDERRGALRQLMLGALAASITYLIGLAVGGIATS